MNTNISLIAYLSRVNASDSDTGLNKEFRFSIADGDLAGQFSVDPHTGDLFVAKPLDREKSEMYVLTIRATNIGKFSAKSVLPSILVYMLMLSNNSCV